MPEMAKTYEFDSGQFPKINGEPVPWFVSDRGPLVEDTDTPNLHILWLPVLVDAPMPTPPEGHPDGEPLVDGAASA